MLSRQSCVHRTEGRRPPPASAETGALLDQPLRQSPSGQFSKGSPASFPLFELQHPQAAVDPRIQVREDPWSVGEFEILLPTTHIRPQFPRDLLQAPPAVPAGHLPDAVLHLFKGFGRDATFDHATRGHPEAVAEECGAPHPRHRAFLLVDPEPELRVHRPQSGQHPLPRPLRPHRRRTRSGAVQQRHPRSSPDRREGGVFCDPDPRCYNV